MNGELANASFDRLISPLSRASFLSEFWGQSFVRIPGQAGRFESLFSWNQLNSILEERRLAPPRLRLYCDGKEIETERYLSLRAETPRLKAGSLVNCLAEGATLILDSIQEFAPGARAIADSCQEVLHADTTVNLYASWRTQKGFDLHWDNQDTMILQVSGRKHWKVYRATRLHPLKTDLVKPRKPVEAPVWEGLLEEGDVIYLPRGWWHVAIPVDEPSLHLTVTITPAVGEDFLEWFMSRLKGHAEARMNVPHPANAAEQRKYASRIRELLLESWGEGLLEQFLAEWESNLLLRSRIRLPLAPIEHRMPITLETQVRLAANRRLSFVKGAENSVSFHANGVRWHCPAGFVPALERLTDASCQSVEQLCSQLPDGVANSKLMTFLTALAMGGAVWMESRDQCP